jgi:hypothetical protein
MERLDRMARYLEGAQEWIENARGRPGEGVSKEYRQVVEGLETMVGHRILRDLKVRGVIGCMRAATGKLGKKAMGQGLYVLLRPYGQLVCPGEENGRR